MLFKERIEVYTFEEFFSCKDINELDRVIGIIRRNKKLYKQLVLYVSFMLFSVEYVAFANEFSSSLDTVGNQIVSMLIILAKWGCMGMGLKSMITSLLNGSNMKQATTEGIQYLLGYVFLQLYPSLFSIFSHIKF